MNLAGEGVVSQQSEVELFGYMLVLVLVEYGVWEVNSFTHLNVSCVKDFNSCKLLLSQSSAPVINNSVLYLLFVSLLT